MMIGITDATQIPTPADRRSLVELGQLLQAEGYAFTTVSPATHRRVDAKAGAWATDLRDVFGWSRPFREGVLPDSVFRALVRARVVTRYEDGWKSAVRFSSLEGRLFVHGAHPTVASDAVFFGPDTMRFCRWLLQLDLRGRRLMDVGAGSGAAGILLADRMHRVVLGDVNPRALAFAKVNAELAGVEVAVARCDVLDDVDGAFDVIVANPPYMADDRRRRYRDGGGELGELLSVRIACDALERLEPGGKLCLYTGSAVVRGRHVLLDAVLPRIENRAESVVVDEIDVDVFGDELEQPRYRDAERIAAIGMIVTRRPARVP